MQLISWEGTVVCSFKKQLGLGNDSFESACSVTKSLTLMEDQAWPCMLRTQMMGSGEKRASQGGLGEFTFSEKPCLKISGA